MILFPAIVQTKRPHAHLDLFEQVLVHWSLKLIEGFIFPFVYVLDKLMLFTSKFSRSFYTNFYVMLSFI